MIILLILVCLAALAVHQLLPVFSGGAFTNVHQVFSDIIIENVSQHFCNKSGELTLFWLLLFIGGLILIIGLAFQVRLINWDIAILKDYRFPLFGAILFFPFLAYLIVFGQFSIPLFTGLVLLLLCYCFCNQLTDWILLTFALTYYALVSVLTILVQFTDKAQLSSKLIYLLTFIIGGIFTIFTIFFNSKNQEPAFCRHLLLILQCFLPGLLTLWLVDDYLYQGQIIRVPYASGYVVFFSLLIAITLFLAVRHARRMWKQNEKCIISAVTPILIFVYHSFSAAPMYAQPDQHHHGEQMIPWNQIFEHGQSLYEEYTPVSGLFPFFNGFIQHVLLDGTVTDYSPAISISMVIFCIITMYLIYKHVGGNYATAFAILFTLPSYNRQYMVLPVLLLLTLPGLLKKQSLWLQVWIYSCFLSGLYYPLYGAGLLIGTIPLGIYQLITYVRYGDFRKDLKKPWFYIAIVILFLVITWNIPLLFRMLKHTLTYSSQTVLADGIPLLGQTAPENFLPWLASHGALRNALYLSFRFLLPAFGVWLFVYVIFYTFFRHRDRKLSLMLLSGAVTLMISYTYTLVRADTDKILSRTAPILIAVAGMFLPIILIHYGKTLLKRPSLVILLGICMALPMVIYAQTSSAKNPDMWVYPDGNSQIVMDDAAKLYSYYEVPETFLKSEDTGLSLHHQDLLGRGFMVADQLHYIEDYAEVIDKCEAVAENVTYMALDGQGFYDYLDVTCSATGYIPAARSYEAQKEIWDAASGNLPVVFYIQPQYSYYIFRFMLEEGYIYSSQDSAFFPPDLYALIYPQEDTDVDSDTTPTVTLNANRDAADTDTDNDYRRYSEPLQLDLSAESFGASMDSLQEIFVTDQTRSLSQGNLPAAFSGTDYDFLYLELNEDDALFNSLPYGSALMITWEDTDGNTFDGSYVDCSIADGKLLIPMGMNACWLLSEMDDFTLKICAPESRNVLYETTYKRLKTSEEDSALIKELSLMQLDIHR
jgi:hypothetical protein